MTTLTLATWNVNSLKVRLEHVLSWLAERDDIDALVLQETKLTDDKFPQGELALAGWESVFYGQPTYNGVALLTRPDRVTVSDVTLGMPGYADEQKRYLSATVTPVGTTESVRFAGVYCPNGMEAGSRKYLYKLDWFHALRRAMQVEREKNERVVLAGDFNIAPADADLWSPQTWPDKILTTGPERTALERLLSDGFIDAFRAFPQKESSSPGGTIGWPPMSATTGFASTSCSQATPCDRHSRPVKSTRRRGPGPSPQTMRPS